MIKIPQISKNGLISFVEAVLCKKPTTELVTTLSNLLGKPES